MTPKTRKGQATKTKMIQIAAELMQKNGVTATTVNDVLASSSTGKSQFSHYFGSKEELFRAVLQEAYLDIRAAEQQLQLADLEPREALQKLVRFTWEYYLENPEFIRLVNSANLHRGRHLKDSAPLLSANRQYVDLVRSILDRGVATGVFRDDVDPVQLNITIAAIGYYYLTNRFTGEILYERDLMTQEALDERLAFNLETILKLVEMPQS